VDVLETVAKPATLTACQQEADSEITSAVSEDTALVEGEIRSQSTDDADTTQSSMQDGCTVEEGCTDGENNCTPTTDAVTRLSPRKRQRLCKSGSTIRSCLKMHFLISRLRSIHIAIHILNMFRNRSVV